MATTSRTRGAEPALAAERASGPFGGSYGRPRTLIVGPQLSARVGVRTVGEELASRLRAEGWSVVTTSAVRNRYLRPLDMQRAIWTQRRCAVAHVEVYSGPAFLWAEAACFSLRMRGVPIVLTLHGGSLPRFARSRQRRVRRLLASAVTVTTPSPYLLEEMAAYRDDFEVVPNALTIANYSFRRRGAAKPRLIWLRAFHQIYRPQQAVEVLSLLKPRHPGATLEMIGPDRGDGSLDRTLRRARELGVEKDLTVTTGIRKSEVPDRVNRGDVFLNTSETDNMPVSVIEAMACGLCVVSTDVGGMKHLLEHGQDGLLCPPAQPQVMATAVERLLETPALASRLSEAGRRRVEAFDWSHVLPRWQKLLSDAARQRHG